jgi:CheY-like chemotaxis protein
LPRSTIVKPTGEALGSSEEPITRRPARRILIADDNVDGAETMGMLLESDGHEVHLAHTGTEAFESAKRLKPDIVVLDIGMPDIDGYEVAQRIRHEAWGSDIVLIAITGWGQADDKRRALAAGFDRHMTKPVDPIQLEQLFEQATRKD